MPLHQAYLGYLAFRAATKRVSGFRVEGGLFGCGDVDTEFKVQGP